MNKMKSIRKCFRCNGIMYKTKVTKEGFIMTCDKCGATAERCDNLLSNIFGGL